ncbi:MAG: lamin tail domain-containing protein [Sandaracinaceae bacterium]|nr:lamin tail domain-containing protein [Sandaracinaceae bacterium]MBK8592548.1 lamin tail domain-containing protein [Sandaracinaceae bacterium]MBP7683178.1 lamin tail domain-containing protein [Deltaproteobacteria bacterium]
MNRPSCLPASAPLALVALSLAASITGCGGDGPSDPCAGLLPGDLVISEVMANPSGADDGREWVEIHNPGSAELSLTGLELVRSAEDGSGARAHVLDTADLLAAGAYYVLGGVLDAARPSYVNYGYGDALGDFGNTSGRVVLRCGDRVIDEVVYLDSTDGASRAYDGDLPPNATANDDTTRWCDSPATFSTGDFGSPGVRNASCGGSSLGRCSEGGVERDTIPPTEGDLVITELHPNPMAVADGEGEWFEVLVQAEVDLNGLQLGKVPGTVLTTLSSSECLSVSPGTYVLFAAGTDSATNGGLTNVDFLADLALSNSGGSVFVGYADVVLDTFTYTSSGDGASTQLDPRHLTFDENDDEALWCRSAATYGDGDRGTPGGANMQCMFPLPEGMCDAGGGTLRQIVPPVLGDVVITELMPDSGAVGDTAGEWFEVYFASDADLNGLEMGTTLGSVGYRIEQEACLRVTAGSYVVFAKDAAGANGGLPGTPIDYDTLTLGNSATSAEPGTLFVGLDGTALDVANWFTSDAGVARSLDVDALDADENQTEANWCAAAATDTYGAGDRGTPGAANPACPFVLPPGQCLDNGTPRTIDPPALGELVITEVLPDSSAVDDTFGEWFEVYASAPVDLNGLQVGTTFGSPSFTLTQDDCVTLAAGDYVLFARNGDTGVNGGLPLTAIEWGGTLSNDPGSLFIGVGDALLDSVAWSSSPTGASLQLEVADYDHTTNDAFRDAACDGSSAYGAGDLGTPGMANVMCPFVLPPGQCLDGGTPRAIVPPVAGDVVITEIMPDTGAVDDVDGEWFEVYFASAADLNGLQMGTTSGTVAYAIMEDDCRRVTAGSYVVFSKNAAGANGGLPGGAVDFNTLTLGNSATQGSPGTLFVGVNDTVLDTANWFGSSTGVAQSLDPDALDATMNETAVNWCAAALGDTYGAGDRGTPGAANPECPLVLQPGECGDNGTARAIVTPGVGDLIITEVMADPAAVGDTLGEWFEVYVATDVDLNGLQAGTTFGMPSLMVTQADCLRVTSGSYVLFARNTTMGTNGGLPPGGIGYTFNLSNDPGALFIGVNGALVDEVAWTASPTGASLQLEPADYDDALNDALRMVACDGTTVYGAGDTGTPGAANLDCLDAGECWDGTSARAIVTPVVGDLYINEVMPNPTAASEGPSEWFELVATADVDLNGLVVANAATTLPELGGDDCLAVTADQFVVFARGTDASANGGLPAVDFVYSQSAPTLGLLNTNGTLSISHESVLLDAVTWTATLDGRSRSLIAGQTTPHVDNDTLTNWCNETVLYGPMANGNAGTPGSANLCVP